MNEIRQNENFLKQSWGERVKFGKEIQLMHFISKEFIEATCNTSNIDKSTYKIQLASNFCYGMLFKLIPKYKLR